MKLFIARDGDGTLALYSVPPYPAMGSGGLIDFEAEAGEYLQLDEKEYPEIQPGHCYQINHFHDWSWTELDNDALKEGKIERNKP